ncbi:MAG: hypothetical protein ACRDY1_11455 [Acidimicrobiales bacterium]
MGFEVLAVRTALQGDPAEFPTVDGSGRVVMEAGDGGNVRSIGATAVAVGQVSGPGIQPLSRIGPVNADVLVTDGRVVVAVTKYAKTGGGNTFGRAGRPGGEPDERARRVGRPSRSVLAGHVRFPWLAQVGASPNHGVRGEEMLRLVVGVESGGARHDLAVDLTFPRTVDSLLVAQEIVQRAARFRLHHMDDDDDATEAVRALSRAPKLVPAAKCYAMYSLPTVVPARPGGVGAGTATGVRP